MAERQGGTVPSVLLSPDFPADHLAFAATNAGVFRSRDGGRSWEISGDGLSSFSSQSIAFSPFFATDRTLFAGSADGSLYRSTDAGDSWVFLASVGRGSSVVTLAAAPAGGRGITLLAGTLADGLFTGTDGEEWKPLNAGLPDLSVIALALSPAFSRDHTAFVATESGLQLTTDGGRSWRQVWSSSDSNSIQCVGISPAFADDRTVFVGTEEQGLLRSTDGGASWTPTNAGLPDRCINALALSPDFARDRTMVAAGGQGIAISTDGGESWRLVDTEPEMILGLAISGRSPAVGQVVLAGLVGGGIVRSEDGGSSWEKANQGLEASYLAGLVLSPNFGTDGTLFAWGLSDGVLRSEDGGKSWQPASSGIEGLTVTDLALSPTFPSDGALYIATSLGVYRSPNLGTRWQRLGLDNQSVSLLALSPAFSREPAMVAVADNTLQWSRDGGADWSTLEAPAEDETPVAVELAIGPGDEHVLLLATWREPLYYRRGRLRVWGRSLREGSWRLLFTRDADVRMAALAIPDSFAEDERFFIGNGEAVYHVVPDAQERTREGVRPIWLPAWVGTGGRPVVSLVAAPNFAHTHTLLAAGGDGVFLSEDGGIRWRRLGETLGNRATVAVAPSSGFPTRGDVYALTMGGRLWKWDPAD
jgi:photosystem II stability/assembly factor-like uncharacterized protein